MKHRIESGETRKEGEPWRGPQIRGNMGTLWKVSAVLGEQVKEQSESPGSDTQ